MAGSSEIGLVSRSQYFPGSPAERLPATGQAVQAAFSPASPLFLYFLFSMACATLRWQWGGGVVDHGGGGSGVRRDGSVRGDGPARAGVQAEQFSVAGACSRRWWGGLVGRLDACQKRSRSE